MTMKSAHTNKGHFRAAALLALGLALLGGCNKEMPKPVSTDETPPEENLEVVVEKAIPVDLSVEDVAPIIDRDCQVSILGYHDFTETAAPTQMRIRIAKFREQMQALKDADLPVIPLRDYMAWRRGELQIPKRCAVITADDGWRDFHTYALPVLKEFGYPFTMYIYTTFLNNGGRSLSDDQVRELIAAGGEIGSHSVSHELLTSKKGFATEEAHRAWVLDEMKASKEELERRFGIKVTSFAYPFGVYNDAMVAMADEVGYHSAVTVNGARAGYERKLLELPRYIIHGNSDANWNMATSFRGSGGLAKANNLLQAQTDENGVDSVPVRTWPTADEIISDRMPEIQVDLSSLEGVDVASITMEVSGFGEVPAKYDTETKVLKWKVPRKLRMESTSVNVRLRRAGQSLPDLISWDFRIDRTGLYLKEQNGEGGSEKVAATGMPERVEVRKPMPVE